jgi:hypothetical protein
VCTWKCTSSAVIEEQSVAVDIEHVAGQIQRNCDISDANYAGLFSLCGLLLRLRDLFKWAYGLPPWEEPEPSTLMEWIDHRESHWENLYQEEYQRISIGGESFDPFDVNSINRRLKPQKLVYGAGYALGMKPSFFLAESRESHSVGELTVDSVGRELARDIFVTPAMRQGSRIFARHSVMLFFMWDQVLEMRPSVRDALVYAFAQYHVDAEALRRNPATLGHELAAISSAELQTWVYHEVGEVRETGFDGEVWQEIVSTYANSPVEIFARVVKDLLADTHPEGLLGHIIRHRLRSSLGFYISFMRPFMRSIFPEILDAFRAFREKDDWTLVEEARGYGHLKAHHHAQSLVDIHEDLRHDGADQARERIVSELIEPLGVLGSLRNLDDFDEED